jgi:glutamine synthetase
MYHWTSTQLKEAGIELLPTNLKEAMEELAKDEVVIEAMGREFCEHYIDFKLREWTEYHNSVSSWELDQYLTMY